MTSPNQPGWYDDPQNPNAQRYWDGQNWTPHRQRKPAAQPVQPSAMSAPPPQPPPPDPSGATLPPPPAYAAAEPEQGDGVPTEPPPPVWPPPGSYPQGAGTQSPSEGLAAATGFAAKPTITAWLLFGGFVLAVIATFLPFVTVSAPIAGSVEVSARGDALGPVFVLVAVAAAFAYPVLSQSQLAVWRLIGLSVVVGLLGILMIHWFSDASSSDDDGVNVSPASGLLLYGAAVIAMVVAVVRLWMVRRSQTQNRGY